MDAIGNNGISAGWMFGGGLTSNVHGPGSSMFNGMPRTEVTAQSIAQAIQTHCRKRWAVRWELVVIATRSRIQMETAL